MNEKFKELARKAGISILYEYDGYDGHAGVANLDDIAKFAELIVLECASIDFYSLPGFGLHHDDLASQVIKEHFGVKE